MTNTATVPEIDAARGYETLFVPAVFAAWTPHLIAGAGIGPGAEVLDVACGTGILARHARAAGAGRVAGVDAAAGMVAVARDLAPDIDFVHGAAEALVFEDASFDAVVSQFGMMFFQDRRAAADEMFRVLRSGGRLAVAVWRGVDHNPAYAELSAVLDAEIGHEAGDAIRLPFALGDAAELAEPFAAAGFAEVAVAAHSVEAEFPSPRAMVEAELRGWLPLFGIRLNEEAIAALLEAVEPRLHRYRTGLGTAAFPTAAHVLTAIRPDRAVDPAAVRA